MIPTLIGELKRAWLDNPVGVIIAGVIIGSTILLLVLGLAGVIDWYGWSN